MDSEMMVHEDSLQKAAKKRHHFSYVTFRLFENISNSFLNVSIIFYVVQQGGEDRKKLKGDVGSDNDMPSPFEDDESVAGTPKNILG